MNKECIGYISDVIDTDRESRDGKIKVIARGTRCHRENFMDSDPRRQLHIQI